MALDPARALNGGRQKRRRQAWFAGWRRRLFTLGMDGNQGWVGAGGSSWLVTGSKVLSATLISSA